MVFKYYSFQVLVSQCKVGGVTTHHSLGSEPATHIKLTQPKWRWKDSLTCPESSMVTHITLVLGRDNFLELNNYPEENVHKSPKNFTSFIFICLSLILLLWSLSFKVKGFHLKIKVHRKGWICWWNSMWIFFCWERIISWGFFSSALLLCIIDGI